MKLKQDFWVGWAIAAIVLSSCWDQTTSQRQQPDLKREISLKAVPLVDTPQPKGVGILNSATDLKIDYPYGIT